MNKLSIIVIGCMSTLIACNAPIRPPQKTGTGGSPQHVAKRIHTDTTNTWSRYHDVRKKEVQLKLAPLEMGFDSLQIRVWFNYSLAYKKHLLLIERKDTEWTGRLYEMQIGYVDTLNYDIIKDYTSKKIVPKSGWQQFINNLYQLKIGDLSGNNDHGADGRTYSVEIATVNSYLYYDFWEPVDTRSTNWQSEKMIRILELLEQEFDFKGK